MRLLIKYIYRLYKRRYINSNVYIMILIIRRSISGSNYLTNNSNYSFALFYLYLNIVIEYKWFC